MRLHWRSRRVLLLFAAASFTLHVALLGVLPGSDVEGPLPPPPALDVVLVEASNPDTPPAPAPPPPPQVAPATPSPPEARQAPPAASTTPAPQSEPRVEQRQRASERAKSRAPAPRSEERAARVPPPAEPLPAASPREEKASDAGDATRAAEAPPAPAQESTIDTPPVTRVTPPAFNASYLRNPAPRYPLIARRNGEQGTVTLRVLVARDGTPGRVSVERTSGSRHLDNAALETVKTWRFVPARKGSEAIEAWVLVPIVFRLERAS